MVKVVIRRRANLTYLLLPSILPKVPVQVVRMAYQGRHGCHVHRPDCYLGFGVAQNCPLDERLWGTVGRLPVNRDFGIFGNVYAM